MGESAWWVKSLLSLGPGYVRVKYTCFWSESASLLRSDLLRVNCTYLWSEFTLLMLHSTGVIA